MFSTIYAMFDDPADAERAAGALLDHGLLAKDLSVLQGPSGAEWSREPERARYEGDLAVPDATGTIPVAVPYGGPSGYGTPIATGVDDAAFRRDASADEDSEDPDWVAKRGITTTTAGDAGEGALKGTAWGAGVGIVAGLASLLIPGVGLVYGSGALAAAIGAAVATTAAGAAAGAVTGYLVDQGVDSHLADRYGTAVTNGGALLAANIPSGPVTEAQARSVLEKYGAHNLSLSAPKGYVS